MSKEQGKQPNDKPDKGDKSIPAVANKQKNSSSNQNIDPTDKKSLPKSWISENWDKTLMVVITGILAYYTYKLFDEATNQRYITKRAVDIADSTLNEGRIKDSIAFRNSIIKDSIDSVVRIKQDIKDERSMSLTVKSIESQLSSLKETQRQFILTNQPFIQVIKPVLSNVAIGKFWSIDYQIENLSNIPVQLISQRSEWSISQTKLNINVIKNAPLDTAIFYVTKEVSITGKLSPKLPMNIFEYNRIMDKTFSLYFVREIKYRNLITGSIRYSITEFRIKPINGVSMFSGNTYYQLIYNRNIDDKNYRFPLSDK